MLKNGKYLFKVMGFLLLFISISAVTYAADYYATYDSVDATANINSAIQSAVNNVGADRVILSYQGAGTKWISGPLELYNDIEFVLEEGVILEAKSNSISIYTPFVLINGRTNVKITGYNATIRMLMDEYTDGEWRHCISVKSAANVEIKGVTLQKSGGDGIYLGNNGTANSNILIEDVVCDGNARNGISVISANNLTITGCILKNTGQYNPSGLATAGPWAGIDFEPNYATEMLSNIILTNCTFDNNKAAGVLSYLGNLDSTSSAVSIDISGCTVTNNSSGIALGSAREGTSGEIDIDNCIIENSGAILLVKWAYNGIFVDISNCTMNNPFKTSGVSGAISIDSSGAEYATGNIILNNIYVLKNKSPYALKLIGGSATYKIKHISGSIYTDQIDASILYNSYYEDINVTLNKLNVSYDNVFSSDLDNIGGTDNELFLTGSSTVLTTGDYNGDGKTDLFVKGYGNYRVLYLANSTGDGFVRAFCGYIDGVGGTDSEAFFTDTSAKIYPGDYNGDGKTDLFVKGYNTWRALYISNGTSFTCAFQGDADNIGGTDNEPFLTGSSTVLTTGDYNGDGKTDLFVKGYENYRVLYLANSTGDGFVEAFCGYEDGVGGTDSEAFFTDTNAKIYPGDYNGDGKTDLFVKGYNTWRALYISNGTTFTCAFQSDADNIGGTDSELFLTGSSTVLNTGDYNGDGKTDLFVKGYGNYRVLYLANSIGDGFVRAFCGYIDGVGGTDSEAFFTDAGAKIYPGDYNGDGKTDLFVKGYNTWRALYIANSAGKSFTCVFQSDADSVGGTDNEAFFTDAASNIYTGDYNGDGKTDMFIKGYCTWRALYNATGNY